MYKKIFLSLGIATLAACSSDSDIEIDPIGSDIDSISSGINSIGGDIDSFSSEIDSVGSDINSIGSDTNQAGSSCSSHESAGSVMPASLKGNRHINFESGPVRPLAISPDQSTLARVNIPNGAVEILGIDNAGMLSTRAQVRVGVEPVAVAFRNNNELWVVNHVSDSVSVVRLDCHPRVHETLLVGDEPRDIVFAKERAFVTTAHRGQRLTDPALDGIPGAGDPQLTTPSIGRADVWVFDAKDTGGKEGGIPKKIINLFGDTPRPLAVSPDRETVYAGIHFSGNQTTIVPSTFWLSTKCGGEQVLPGIYERQGEYLDWGEESVPCDGNGSFPNVTMPGGLADGLLPGKLPPPATNAFGEPAPPVSLIVKYDNDDGVWKDVMGRNWNNAIRFSLPDHDVFEIDADTLNVGKSFPHIGTTLFNMATNPINGKIYVSNTDANNLTRFEGPGDFGGSTVQGKIALSQITVIDPSSSAVTPVHLNSHIAYDVRPAPVGVKEHSLATPLDMVVSPNGENLYVAAFGSGKVGVIPTSDLESGAISPKSISDGYLNMTGGGPSGLVLNSTKNKLYVSTRFDNGLSVIDLGDDREIQHMTFSTPESRQTIEGRFMLYDAVATSSNGEASCASCHIFGDVDHLSWDLGNPDEPNSRNPQPKNLRIVPDLACTVGFVGSIVAFFDEDSDYVDLCHVTNDKLNGVGDIDVFSSMKGPMTTQTLKGMHNHGNTHWRADRAIGYFYEDDAQTLNAKESFKNFIVAFPGLVGMDVDLPENSLLHNKSNAVGQLESDMFKFTDFMFNTYLPPNPIRRLDNQLTDFQEFGAEYYFGDVVAGVGNSTGFNEFVEGGLAFNCNGCHAIDPEKGFYGSNGRSSFTIQGQNFKIPHQRNFYTKVGMFGSPDVVGTNPSIWGEHMGDQIRGFAGGHDGAASDLVRLLSVHDFNNLRNNARRKGDDPTEVRYALQDFVFASASDVAPVLGQQVTLNSTSSQDEATQQRFGFLKRRAQTGFVSKEMGRDVNECRLVGSGIIDEERVEVIYNSLNWSFVDKSGNTVVIPVYMNDLDSMTFTCLPDAR